MRRHADAVSERETISISMIDLAVRNMEAKRGIHCASVATRGHFLNMIQMRGPM